MELIDHAPLEARTAELRGRFAGASPYPHLILDGLLRPDVARDLERAFPTDAGDEWTHYRHFNNNTMGLTDITTMPALAQDVIRELNAPRFTGWLAEVTGFSRLRSDDMLEGGGLHMTRAGGYLNLHADFTNHHYHAKWQRRCNLILFLNSDWQEEWGGALELWARDLSAKGATVPVRNNLAVIFETARDTFHGYPDPLTCPPGAVRKSLALYYYTEEATVEARATNYRVRPGEGLTTRMLVAADRTALSFYTRIKQRLGLSDRFASDLLKRLGGRRKE